jgi:S-(hydroxymethyl)glutathione dehydrogenase/alcohol dehydrogenase
MSPKKMLAAILAELRKPLVLDEVVIPETLECGQVLVKVYCTGICGSQIGEIDGVKGDDPYLPHLLGHEGSAEVIEIGPGVRHVKPGDYVVMHWRKGVGIEANPPVYSWKGRRLNAGWVTTFNQYAVVSENRITPIPKDMDMQIAPLFGCAVTTGFGVITNNAQLKIGESVIVMGAGGIGLSIVQAAAMMSAYPIIAVDLFDNRLGMAKKFGATHCLNSNETDITDEIQKIMGSDGADVVVDNTGNPDVISMAHELTQAQGRTILVGVPRKGDNISIYSLPLHFGKVLTGSHGGESNPAIDIPKYIRLYRRGILSLDELITDRYEFQEIGIAMEKLRNGEIAGRCMIKLA